MLDIRRLLALFFVAAMPLLALEILGQIQLRHDHRQGVEAEASRLLHLIEIEEQRTFDGIRRILATLERTEVPRMAPERCRDILSRLKQDYSEHLAVAFRDEHGVMGCASHPELTSAPADAFPSAGEALAAGGFAIGTFTVSPVTGRPALTFALAYRDAEDGRVGTAVAMLETAWIERTLSLRPWPVDAAILLTDRNHVVLARLPEEPGLVGTPLAKRYDHLLEGQQSGVTRIIGIEGVPRIVAYSPIAAGTPGIYTGVAIASEPAMAAVDQAAWRSLAAFSGMLLLCSAGAAWGVRKHVRVHERASATQRKMAAVLATITDAVAEVDRDWCITYANPRALALAPKGVQLVGTHLWGHFPEQLDTATWAHCQQAMEERKSVEFEVFGACTGRWYLVRGFPSGDDGVTFYLKDISERKGAEATLRRHAEQLRLAVSAADAGTFDIDLKTGAGSASPEACLMHGLATADSHAFARDWARHLHPDDREPAVEEHGHVIAEARSHFDHEYRVVHADGQTHWIAMRGSVLKYANGTALRMVGITLDVTAHRNREEALEVAMHEAELAEQAKSKFIAVASHDLRQPLQSLFFFMDVLRGQVAGEHVERCVSVIEGSLTTLKELLDGLLDLSRLDAGGIQANVEPFALDDLLTEIATAYTPVVRGKGLEFRWSPQGGAMVRSDRVLVGRMVRNLVENAIRYTPEGAVTLSSRRTPAGVEIRISDTGIGIPADQLGRIFEEFHQVDGTARRRGQGLGLGLSIVQRLSRILDHPVSVSSEVGAGTTFSILIPSAALVGDLVGDPALQSAGVRLAG